MVVSKVYGDIRFRRGPESEIPTLPEGQPAITEDTKRIFVGSDSGNIELAKKEDLDGKAPKKKTDAWVDVKEDFGAKGDGVTDDTTAIQNAIDYALSSGIKKVKLVGKFVITSPLNLTNISNGSLTIEGNGMGQNGEAPSLLLGRTGREMIDTTGSQFITIKDMALVADSTNPSTVGILFARSISSIYAQFNQVENVYINMGTNTSANGGAGTIGIYNFGAELHRYRNIFVIADRTVVITFSNWFSLTSRYTTIMNQGYSTSQIVIDGASTLIGYNKSNVFIDNACAVKFDMTYMYMWSNSSVANGNTFAYEIWGGCTDIQISGHIEGCLQLLQLVGSIQSLQMNVTKQMFDSSDQIVLNGSNPSYQTFLSGAKINVVPMLNTTTWNKLINQVGTNHKGIKNSEIILYPYQNFYVQTGATSSITLKVEDEGNSAWLLSSTGDYKGTIIQSNTRIIQYGTVSNFA